jgi:hypothetical protein
VLVGLLRLKQAAGALSVDDLAGVDALLAKAAPAAENPQNRALARADQAQAALESIAV